MPSEEHFSYLPGEIKAYTYTNSSTQMFTEALFVIGQSCKQSKFPYTHEWIKKIWYIYLKYCLSVKGNEVLIHATK